MKPLSRACSPAEWNEWVTDFLRRYDAMDRALVQAGYPATSPWWRAELERFLRARRRRWVPRVGRRGGKSSTMCRLAVAWAKWGPWSVPPGDTAVIAFVSVDRDEASSRLRTIASILRVLEVGFDERSDELEMHERGLVFRVASCSIRSVGFTSVMLVADEMARWESRENSSNPAQAVMSSMRPTGATQAFWFECDVSAPWSIDDYHAQLFDDGDTEHQVVSFAPTWVANPSITESDTHELEADPIIWEREYAAVPGAVVTAALDPADVAASFGQETSNARMRVLEVGGWADQELRGKTMRDITRDIAARAKAWGADTVYGDQREEASLRDLFSEAGVGFRSFAWSLGSKDAAFQTLRRLQRERQLSVCDHPLTRSQMVGAKARLNPSGTTSYDTNGKDYLSAIITLMHAANENLLHGQPYCAIDASSLRNDAFTYVCGRGASSDVDRGHGVLFSIRSARFSKSGHNEVRMFGRRRKKYDLPAEERQRQFLNDEPNGAVVLTSRAGRPR
ncbi:MAG TPA: hypothetical protein VJN18_14840 [Polyangiaceae bacterium]|nr:hypothetical protein [Polyangiaceae bacterium]